MGMARASMAPPPSAAAPSPLFGGAQPQPDPNAASTVSPAPAQAPSPQAMTVLNSVHAIVSASRAIAELYPTTVNEVGQINDLVQQIQMKIVQSLPPTEVAAPPV